MKDLIVLLVIYFMFTNYIIFVDQLIVRSNETIRLHI